MFFKKIFGIGKTGADLAREEVEAVDTDMNYCPVCDEEYRPDITSCVHCDVELVSGRIKHEALKVRADVHSRRSMDISSDDSLVTLEKGDMKDMKHLKNVLAIHTVPALLTSDGPGKGG